MDATENFVTFCPWEGPRKDEGISGKQLLILGESHYHSCEDDIECRGQDDETRDRRHKRLTQEVVDWWSTKPHRSPLSYRLPTLFGIDKQDFWEKVSFYNYLQTFAGLTARVRPSEDQWSDPNNWRALQQVLDELKPDRVLVLGKKLWANLPSDPQVLAAHPKREAALKVPEAFGLANQVDLNPYWYFTSDGSSALAMPIIHPSAPGFLIGDWKQPVYEWISFPANTP